MELQERINEIQESLKNSLRNVSSEQDLLVVYSKFFGKSGLLSGLSKELGKAPKEDRPKLGKAINEVKNWAETEYKFVEQKIKMAQLQRRYQEEKEDITLPGKGNRLGALNPITLIKRELIDIFIGMGFSVYDGPEIEDDYHNFTALNTPQEHPARDKQDTFYINDDLLLRTHTSPGQIRVMEQVSPPIKVLVPGRVFRCDDDATHTPMFNQMEGLVVDKSLSLCDLHGLLDKLAKAMFSVNTKTRFRPSFFPFTEPSVEVDVSCCECGGTGCRLCKGTGWIEILGGGVVNRRVLENCGLDPNEYSGLAFGLGLDRIAMLKYGINNIHIIYDNDVRILSQFKK